MKTKINKISKPQRSVRPLGIAAGIILATAAPASAQTFTMDFNTDASGAPITAGSYNVGASQPYANLYGPGSGVRLSTDNPSERPLNIFDTESLGGQDPDLQRNSAGTGMWAVGNLGSEIVGNSLIVNTNTNLGTPNDWAGGGTLAFVSDLQLTSLDFTFLDLDRASEGSLILRNSSTNMSTTIAFADFAGSSGSVFSTPGVAFGDRAGNRMTDILASEAGLASFDQFSFVLTGSGAVGEVKVTLASDPVPEPGALVLLGLGTGFALLKRRR